MLLMGSSLVAAVNCAGNCPAAAPVKLNGTLVAGGDVSSARFSADGSRVVYVADQDTDNVPELYSVPVSGGTSVKLNGSLASGDGIEHFVLPSDPVASHLLYLADQETPLVEEVFSVPIAGGTPVKLNGPLVFNGGVSVMQISGDGTQAFYRADQMTDNVFELYQVPATGGTPVKINDPLVAGGDVSDVGLQFSPDGSWILYHADQNVDGTLEIFTVPTSGGTPVRLNATLPVNGDVSTDGLQFSPDGSRVMYVADQEVLSYDCAYSVVTPCL